MLVFAAALVLAAALVPANFFFLDFAGAFGVGWMSPTSMLESDVGGRTFLRFGGLSASDSESGDTTWIVRFVSEGAGGVFVG